jgi:hypothetical protein
MVMQISNADYNLLILREKLMMMMPGRGKRSRTCIGYGMMLMASHKSFSLLSKIHQGEHLYYDYNAFQKEYPTQHLVWKEKHPHPAYACGYI